MDVPDTEEPWIEVENVHENVWTAVQHLRGKDWGNPQQHAIQRQLTREAIEQVNQDGAFDLPLAWYYGPMEAVWSLDHFEVSGIVYDCMDELSQFKGATEELVNQERRVLNRADVVFTGGYELYLKKSKQHGNVHFFGCGVEYSHFSLAQKPETVVPEDVANLARPIIGWFGVVDERVDYDLLREMAALRPDWSFVMVGPVVKVDPASLPQAPNLHWLGGREYKDLPRYCKSFDVCMMAFAINEATEYINPTKALEYLSTGKPVLSTPVADVVRQYTDTVYIEKDAQAWIARIEQILQSPDQERIHRGLEKAKEASWESTVAQMRELIAQATESGESDYVPAETRTGLH